MKPIKFPEVNVTYAEDQPEYQPLPVFRQRDGIVVSCWELTDEEIEKIKESKQIFLSVMTFNQPLQPLFLTAHKEEVINI